MVRRIDRIVVTEADLREQVRTLCDLYGWKMYFTWTSIHSPQGFPDLVLANPEQKRIVYAELKSEKGKVTEKQREWLDALEACGAEVWLWRPADIEGIALILSPNPEYVHIAEDCAEPKMIEVGITGQTLKGYWATGLFIVPSEKRAYYKDDKGEWRYFSFLQWRDKMP